MQSELVPSQSTLTDTIDARRERMHAQAAGHRARVDEIEARLLEYLDRATEQLADERASMRQRQADYERLLREVELRQLGQKERGAELDRLAADLERRSAELTYHQESLGRRDTELQRFASDCQLEAQRRSDALDQREAECLRREAEFERVATAQAADREATARRHTAAEQALSKRVIELDDRYAALEALAAQVHQEQQAVIEDRQRAAEHLHTAQEAEHAALKLRAEIEHAQAELESELNARRIEMEAELAQQQAALETKFTGKQMKLAAEHDARQAELEARAARLQREEASVEEQREAALIELAMLRKHAEERLALLAQDQTEQAAAYAARQAELDARAARLQREEMIIAEQREAAHKELVSLKKHAEERLALIAADQVELAADQQRTHDQRRRLAEHLRRQRDALREESAHRLAEIDARSAETNVGQEALVQDLRRECERMSQRLQARDDELSAELAAHTEARAELASLSAQADQRSRECAQAQQQAADAAAESRALRAEVASLAEECTQMRDQLQNQAIASTTANQDERQWREMVDSLSAERDQLARRLSTLEAELATAREVSPAANDADQEREFADLTQRYEMAVRDIRELKKQNEELAKRPASGPLPPSTGGGALDWEARKRQLLASLEEDEESADEDRRGQVLQMEEVVRATNLEIEERDRQIEELRQQLAAGESAAVAIAETSVQINDFLEKDELVLQERNRLKQLQAEWEDKLRQAEIDMSMQRAQIARAQAELAERQRALEEQGSLRDARSPNDAASKSKKAPRGRWLSRLGLSEDDPA